MKLNSKDFNITQSDYCLFFEIVNCPPEFTTVTVSVPPAPALPALNITVDSWDKTVPLFELRSSDVLPSLSVTCHGILAAASTASALKASDLESWTAKELLNCIDVLGSIDWPLDTKLEVFKLIKSKMVIIFI